MTPRQEIEPGTVSGQWWHRLGDGRLQCDLCPRYCRLHEGQKGFCFVREARNGEIVLTSYGRASGFCIDPIEKKPLNHFYPGSSVLSFGTAGCNLGCRFCQNWDISKARESRTLASHASPRRVAEAAVDAGCTSIAFTYTDPVTFAEYAIDCAQEAHALGVRTVAVSAGYISPEARAGFFRCIDAANIDLKAFTERFYDKVCFAHLTPVLDTLEWLARETRVWLEVTTLIIPGQRVGRGAPRPGRPAALHRLPSRLQDDGCPADAHRHAAAGPPAGEGGRDEACLHREPPGPGRAVHVLRRVRWQSHRQGRLRDHGLASRWRRPLPGLRPPPGGPLRGGPWAMGRNAAGRPHAGRPIVTAVR